MSSSNLWILSILALLMAKNIKSIQTECGGLLTEQRGNIKTPNFPEFFIVPITCVWIIDGSWITTTNQNNISIIVYLTQLYVLSGIKFTEYMYYSDDYKVPSQNIIELSEDEVTNITMLKFSSPYLEIKFTMDNLHGTHLRVLDRLLDVYGFNITYEIDTIKSYQCNTKECSFLGHCYAAYNFSSYYCSCYSGITGKNCENGPLCHDLKMQNYCENGGTCKHIGDAAVACICPPGFKGNQCNIPIEEELPNSCNAENSENCLKQCVSTDGDDNICKCTTSVVSSNRGRARFEATVRLGNIVYYNTSDNGETRFNDNLSSILERHISRFLRNFNITKFNDLEVFSKSSGGSDITFQFFGAKTDGTKVREAVNKMVERGRLGNFSLIPTYLSFRQEPGLMLQSVVLNQRTSVREGSELILSCVAQGSSKMMFRWYKNGFLVNVSRATRNMWTRLLPLDFKDHYTALLGISKASKLDEGIYTCQVSDWGMQQCLSTRVYVHGPPQLQVYPPSVTLYRGESLRVRCLSPGNEQKHGTLGYSWTKNGALFQSNPNYEMWEDLYPDGSLLKIHNIQKSVEYACIVSNSVAPVSSSVYITVVDRGLVELCPADTVFSVNWPASAPGRPIFIDCPRRTKGHAERICEQRDLGKSEWLQPNFSNCLSNSLRDIYNEFRGLTFGYQNTNGSVILQSCLEYTMNRHTQFLPGEGGFLLRLLHEVVQYVKVRGSQIEQEFMSDIILKITDIIMDNEYSLNNQQQVKELQDLIQLAVINRDDKSLSLLHLNSFRVHSLTVKGLPFSTQINSDQLFSDQLYIDISSVTNTLNDVILNGTILSTIVSYKNLTNFLPRIYFARNSHGTDITYILGSRIISSWLFYVNRSINESIRSTTFHHLPLDIAHIEIIFHHENSPNNDWMPLCGYDTKATFEPSWRTDLCITENLMENLTRCVCPLSGTFVVLLTKKNYNTTEIHTQSKPLFVIISCGCCFLQSCIAFTILLPVLYTDKCCITFLKVQFCTATSTAMSIFILGFLKLLPQDWFGLISTSLTALLLLGSSTLIAITLVVQSELGPRRKSGHSKTNNSTSYGIKGAIGLSWLFPCLCAICVPLVHNIVEQSTTNWWLNYGTFGFTLFIITDILFVILFCFLFITLIKKLFYLAKKHDKYNTTIIKRIGLLYRIAIIFLKKILTDIFYLVHLNTNEFKTSYVFGIFTVLLGFSILSSFIIKPEIKLQIKSKRKNDRCSKKSFEENICSGSINSPLSFFTNQDVEKDNESIPPTTKLPLTMLPSSHHNTIDRNIPVSVETFLVGGIINNKNKHQNQQQQQQQQQLQQHHHQQQQQLQHHQDNLDYSGNAYNVKPICFDFPNHCNLTEDVNNDWHQHLHTQKIQTGVYDNYNQNQEKLFVKNEFVGVGRLDILQGVSKDSIIGIRTNSIELNKNHKIKTDPDEKQKTIKSFVSSSSPSSSSSSSSTSKLQTGTTISTVAETIPTTLTTTNIIPTALSSSSSSSASSSSTITSQLQINKGSSSSVMTKTPIVTTPIITITSSDEDSDVIDGMLDRISHDLDYLLNRTTEIPAVPVVVRRSSCGKQGISDGVGSLVSNNMSVHEVIIEESEE